MKNFNVKTALAAVLLITGISLSPVMKAGFVNWDDDSYVVANPRIVQLDAQNVKAMFTTFHRGLYKPVTMLSLALDYKIAGLNPKMYHATNLALHLANCALVLFIGLELGMGVWAAFFFALFFGIHPMNVESAAWVSERKEVLHGMFFLSAFYSYLRWRAGGGRALLALSPLLFAAGMMVKPQGLFLPVALLIADWAKRRKLSLADKIPLFAVSLGFGALAFYTLHSANMQVQSASFGLWQSICIAAHSLLAYTFRFAMPAGLSAMYPRPNPGTALPWDYLLSPFAALLVWAGLFYVARKDRRAVAGLLFFLAGTGPQLQFFATLPNITFDHYAYIPYLGLLCAAIAAAENIIAASPRLKSRVFALAGAAALVLAGMSFARARVWQDSLSLWSDVLSKHPNSIYAWANFSNARAALGDNAGAEAAINTGMKVTPKTQLEEASLIIQRCGLKIARGDFEGGEADCRRGISISPYNIAAWQNLGVLHAERKNYTAALIAIKTAAAMSPRAADVIGRLAGIYELMGDTETARAAYLHALELNPEYAGARKALVAMLSKSGGDDLRRWLAEHSGIDPNSPPAYLESGKTLLENENFRQAAEDLSQAINLGYGGAQAYAMRGAAYGALKMTDNSLKDYESAIAAQPDFIDAYYNRGFMFIAMRRYGDALRDMNKVLSLKPDSGGAYLNRGGIYLSTGKPAEAAADFSRAIELGYGLSAALSNRAIAYMAMGKGPEAMADLNRALSRNPYDFKALVNRSAVSLRLGDAARSLADAQAAVKIKPGDRAAQDALKRARAAGKKAGNAAARASAAPRAAGG
ncbi:MAG: tetratricopeptide repeat protein [Elusimicrobiales bacterium]